MSVQEETLLWKYIDGECSAEEQQQVEHMLDRDERLRQSFDLMQRMHEKLSEQSPDQPSMRFTKNLMEQLPQLYTSPSRQPLMSPAWIYGITAVLVLAAIVASFFQTSNGAAAHPPFGLNIDLAAGTESAQGWLTQHLPSAGWIFPIFGLSLLVLLDRYLGKVVTKRS